MSKVYEKAKDLHVVGTYVYKKTGETYAYSDSAKTKKVSAAALKDMFLKGLFIMDGDVEYIPVSYSESEGVGTVTYVKADTTTATTAVLATLTSE